MPVVVPDVKKSTTPSEENFFLKKKAIIKHRGSLEQTGTILKAGREPDKLQPELSGAPSKTKAAPRFGGNCTEKR